MKDLLKLGASDLLAEFAQSGAVAPSAGSAAALTAALAAALAGMVARLTVEKAASGSAALRARYGVYSDRARQLVDELDRLATALQELMQRDAELVEAMIASRRAQSGSFRDTSSPTPGESFDRVAAELPVHIARAALEVASYAEELFEQGYQSAAEDARAALTLALAAAQSSAALATANLAAVNPDESWPGPMQEECHILTARILEQQVRTTCRAGGPTGGGEPY